MKVNGDSMSNEDKILKGTTTVGITCEDGVVFASERRATMGNLVAHKVAEKIFKIDNHIAATIAGSVGDAQAIMKVISAEVSLYRLRNGKKISIEAAAALSANILRSNPAYIQTLIGGVDDTGASVYSLDAAGGMKIMTIHSFCQSLLKRFPLEAAVPPHFDVLDDLSAITVKEQILNEALINPHYQKFLQDLSALISTNSLLDLLERILNESPRLMRLLVKYPGGIESLIFNITS